MVIVQTVAGALVIIGVVALKHIVKVFVGKPLAEINTAYARVILSYPCFEVVAETLVGTDCACRQFLALDAHKVIKHICHKGG